MEKKRDTSVDLIKIAGCFLVTALHINSSLCTFIDQDIHNFYLSVFLLGVPVFLMQAGFFLFRPVPILKRYSRYFSQLLVPAILVGLVLTWMYPWTIGQASLLSTLLHPDKDSLLGYGKSIINWTNTNFEGPVSHLWYMVEYTKCLLIAPLIAFVCKDEKEAAYIRRILLGILLIGLIFTDMTYLSSVRPPSIWYVPFTNGMVYMLMGYEIYTAREYFQKRRLSSIISAAIIFILLFILRLVLMKDAGETALVRLTDYNSLLSLGQATCLIIAFLCIPVIPGKAGRVVSYIGSRTFLMYLIHLIFAQKAITRELALKIHTIFAKAGAFGEIVYCLFMGLLIFLIAFIVSSILHEIRSVVKRAFSRKETMKH